MAITLQDASEVVSGLVLTNKLSSSAVRTEILFPPYNEVIKLYKEGVSEPEVLIERVGLGPVSAALEAVKHLNGLSGANWIEILENTAMKYNCGIRMEKLGKKLQRGDDVDPVEVRHVANQFGKGKTGRMCLSDIQSNQMPFIATGWKALDVHLGGIPEVGLVVVGGNPGVGKTTFMRDLTVSFAKKHPKKRLGIYSLEMILPEILGMKVDHAHKGPSTGSREWLKGNIAYLYLKDLMIKELTRGRIPPQLVLRGHYHSVVQVFHRINGPNNEIYRSWLYVLPALCGANGFAIEATASEYEFTNGIVAFEVINGKIRETYEFTRTMDTRIGEVLL